METPSHASPIRRDDLSEAKRRLLEQRMRGGAARPAERIAPRDRAASTPISAEQYRIWLHAMQQPELPLYNEPVTIHRRGSFDLHALEAAFNEILRRHEAWRTSFALEEGELVQVVHPELRVTLSIDDLSQLPAAEREAAALRLMTADAAVPIPMDAPPLFRTRVIRIAEDDHRLHLTLHHIIFDGVSIYRILMPELAALYAAYSTGSLSPLPEPELQYGDYAVWRRKHVESSAVARHVTYWKEQFAGEIPVLKLPMDRPRPAAISHRGSMFCFAISAERIAALRALSKAHGVTLYMTLLAAFKVLLFRYSQQEDIVVGGATDARRRPELEGLMGYFLDTFAMRTRPTEAKTFAEYLIEVKASVLGALAAADVPFDRVVQAVKPRRDASHHPLFQAFFSIEPPVAPFAEGWDLTQMDVTVGSSKFDIYLELDERPDHMAARFMYNTDIFDAPTMVRMAEHWQVMLEAVCATPGARLSELPLLTSRELAEIAIWNQTTREFPQQPLHVLLEARASETPEATTVSFASTAWSYKHLNARANFLATSLRNAGAGPGTLVAVLLPRSLDMLAGMIAILKTGAAYLPLDPETPHERIELCLDQARPAAVLTNASLAGTFKTYGARTLLVEEQGLAENFSSTGTAKDSAYVIHTSGTTGAPKGVEITHCSLVNLLASMQRQPGFGPADVLLAVTTVSFDIAALELFLPLFAGGRLAIASREEALDPLLLAKLIETSGCTVMQATPSTWRALLGSGWKGSSRPLRVLCGGEPLPRELAERLLACGVDLWNVYGPTETTIWSTVHHVASGSGPVSIGHPIANTTAYLLDAQHQLLPIGAAGELFLGGTGLAVGYRGQPELTDERFIELRGERLYRTGDLAVRRADGAIECLGRVDHQVKVRGFRVELEAVEAAVVRHPHISAAAARVWPEPAGGTRLSVYITGADGPPPDQRELRHFLQGFLPEYMIPSDVVVLSTIPLTASGKTNRAVLPQPARDAVSHIDTAAATIFEQRIAAIWADLLSLESVDIEADFFDLGGHSLLVAALQHRIASSFGERVTMAALFHAPTVRQQAALVEKVVLKGDWLPDGVLALQPMGSRPAIFWLHPPPPIRNLTEALGAQQPVYGVVLTQNQMEDLGTEPTLEAIAAQHVEAIVKTQARGPYLLAGLCTGGIVAYEVAAQLRAANHAVELVILLDSQNPVFYKRVDNLTVELSKIRFHLTKAWHNGGRSGPVPLPRRLMARIRALTELRPPTTTEMSAEEQMTDYAAYRYHPPASSGNTLLLQPRDRPTEVNYLPGWTAVASRLIAMDVDGHHDELLTDTNVQSVAAAIKHHVARVVQPSNQISSASELIGLAR